VRAMALIAFFVSVVSVNITSISVCDFLTYEAEVNEEKGEEAMANGFAEAGLFRFCEESTLPGTDFDYTGQELMEEPLVNLSRFFGFLPILVTSIPLLLFCFDLPHEWHRERIVIGMFFFNAICSALTLLVLASDFCDGLCQEVNIEEEEFLDAYYCSDSCEIDTGGILAIVACALWFTGATVDLFMWLQWRQPQ